MSRMCLFFFLSAAKLAYFAENSINITTFVQEKAFEI